ncbi:cytoplasmic protein [Rhizobiales bacterium RZME27]|uniref:Cytoplasmic protein n=1 Tax=Endobacterium cereale TaxID=2663029 RepID=A0A6A8AG61_9HYPH|nr:BrnA antitoxin family protein [Endobacterium cereale]MEB2845575.1 BrnA antitoxin family protein [Endobacterium cereale]MQY48797.1 cytoplasmic protein [Endobacterium cereale]
MSKTVRHEVDLNNLPPLTEAQKAEIETLATTPDEQIDTSDIPELDEAFWKNAMQGRFYKPTKTATTVRVDSDVLAWLKGQGKGYQTRMNAILRRAMLADLDQNR